MGNVRALTTAGSVSRSYTYDEWGRLAASSGSLADYDRARWKGALWMGPELDLYYMRNRWYEPRTGRFLSEDPIGLGGGINQYVFASDDPINGRDPTGLSECYSYTYSVPGNTRVTIENGEIRVTLDYKTVVLTDCFDDSWGGSRYGSVGGRPSGGAGGTPSAPATPNPGATDPVQCGIDAALAFVTVGSDILTLGTLGMGVLYRIGARGAMRMAATTGARAGGGATAAMLHRGVREARAGASRWLAASGNSWMQGTAQTTATGSARGTLSIWDYVPVVASVNAMTAAARSCSHPGN